jgi:hypothetical protein
MQCLHLHSRDVQRPTRLPGTLLLPQAAATCSAHAQQRAHLGESVGLPVLDNLQGLRLRWWLLLLLYLFLLLLLLLLLLTLQTLLLSPALLATMLVVRSVIMLLCDFLLLLAAMKNMQQPRYIH